MPELKGANQTVNKLFKCPYCGGSVNRYQPIGVQGRKVLVLVECWSGNLSHDTPHHVFVVKLKTKGRTRRVEEFDVSEVSPEDKQAEAAYAKLGAKPQ